MYSTSTLLYQFIVKIYELIIYVSERVLVWVDRRKKNILFCVHLHIEIALNSHACIPPSRSLTHKIFFIISISCQSSFF